MPGFAKTIRPTTIALALLVWGASLAQAGPLAQQAPAPGLAPFTHDAVDDKVLAWAKRWADENLDDPTERFAMLSYAISAAQRRQVIARANDGYDLSDSNSSSLLTEFTHLRHVNFLAELRTVAASPRSRAEVPDWSARHLCNGTLITPRWILTTATCAAQPAAAKGIEARLGVRDLSQDGGISRRVTRIVQNPAAGLALLELDAAATTEGAMTIEPPPAMTQAADTASEFHEYLGIGFGRVALPGWPEVLYRHFSLPFGAQRLCAGDDGSPIYIYDLQQGPLLAGILALPPGTDSACLDMPDGSQAPVISVVKWANWIEKITGQRSIVTQPRQETMFVPQAH